jgi:hypothetical protein
MEKFLTNAEVDALFRELDKEEPKDTFEERKAVCEPFFIRHMGLRKEVSKVVDPNQNYEEYKKEFHQRLKALYQEIHQKIDIKLYQHFLNVRLTVLIRDGLIDGGELLQTLYEDIVVH